MRHYPLLRFIVCVLLVGLLGQARDGVAQDVRPHIVFVIAESEYNTKDTLPAFAKKYLDKEFRCSFVHANPNDRNDVPGLEVLCDADLLVLSMRRCFLPVPQMDHLERFIRAGKPLVVIRVSCAAFAEQGRYKRPGPGQVVWQRFDQEVLGCNYQGYDGESRKTGCDVWILPEAADYPILKDVKPAKFHSRSWPYKMRPLAETATPLMMGRSSKDKPEEPVAWTNTYNGGRVFYTSLEQAFDIMCVSLEAIVSHAQSRGVRFAVELHNALTARPDMLVKLTERFGPDELGVNFDTGNSFLAGNDPVEYLRKVADRVIHVHIKDIPESQLHERGKVTGTRVGVAAGDGVLDLPGIVDVLAKAGYQGVLSVECDTLEQAKKSLPYLNRVFAESVAGHQAARRIRLDDHAGGRGGQTPLAAKVPQMKTQEY